jgi:translocation and assembly module TamA
MNTEIMRIGRSAGLCRWLLAIWLLCLLPVRVAVAEPSIELDISGVEGPLLDNVRAHLSLSQYVRNGLPLPLPLIGGKTPPKLPSADQIRSLHRRAVKEIQAALQPYGYYDPVIESSLEQRGERWIAHFRIDHGKPVLIEAVDVAVTGAGQGESAIKAQLARVPLHIGSRLIHPDYDAFRAGLLRVALDAGYLDARYTKSDLRVYPEGHRAGVVLHLDTGPRYYFGPVTIEQDILAPDFVSRYVTFHQGEPFDTARLLKLQLALGDSGYFDQVELDARREQAQDSQVPVVVHTMPAVHTRYKLGLGYGTDTGPRVSLGADYLRLNRYGHGLNSNLRVSPYEQTATVNYTIPIRNLVTDRLVIGGSVDNSTDIAQGGNSRSYKFGVSQNVSLGSIQRNLYINYLHESFVLGSESDTVDFVIPGVSLSQLKSDNVLFPRRGYSWSVDLHGAPGVISATRFARVDAALRGVYPVSDHARLIGRTELGATTVEDFSSLPASERFFAGGDQSVRGYDYQTLAPLDSTGAVVGGRYLAVASLELDYLFAGNFGAAVFVDTGNAGDHFLPQPKTGAGIGFRWRSPVGMLRIDLAHPFDDPDSSYRIHISIGPAL